jgi:hypothetical protein
VYGVEDTHVVQVVRLAIESRLDTPASTEHALSQQL